MRERTAVCSCSVRKESKVCSVKEKDSKAFPCSVREREQIFFSARARGQSVKACSFSETEWGQILFLPREREGAKVLSCSVREGEQIKSVLIQ